jgi:hypothetical protein
MHATATYTQNSQTKKSQRFTVISFHSWACHHARVVPKAIPAASGATSPASDDLSDARRKSGNRPNTWRSPGLAAPARR